MIIVRGSKIGLHQREERGCAGVQSLTFDIQIRFHPRSFFELLVGPCASVRPAGVRDGHDSRLPVLDVVVELSGLLG